MEMTKEITNRPLLILTAHFGAGHIRVAEALEIGLDREGAASTILDFFELTAPRLNKVLQVVYLKSIKWTPRLYGAFYSWINNIRPDSLLQKWFTGFGYDALLAYLKRTQPEIVVCDYPIPGGVTSQMKAGVTMVDFWW